MKCPKKAYSLSKYILVKSFIKFDIFFNFNMAYI